MDTVLKILEKRATDEARSPEVRNAYNTALILVLSALEGREEIINQFDY